jgi:hypothetical protein
MSDAEGLEVGGAAYPRVLSTRFTFFFKFVFPVLWLSVMASAITAVVHVNVWLATPMVIIVALVVALFWFYAWPIKKVLAYRDHLVVSNFMHTTRIAYSDIESVREVRWINWRPTVVTLKTTSAKGRSFIYYPVVDSLFGGFGKEREATLFLRKHLTP